MTLSTILPGPHAVRYEELQWDSPKEQFSTLESQVVRKFKCYWKDREGFINDLLGGEPLAMQAGIVGLGSPGMMRQIPHSYLDFSNGPEGDWLWCRRIMMTEGVGPRGKEIQNAIIGNTKDVSGYELAFVTAMYESVTFNVAGNEQVPAPGGVAIADEGSLLASGLAASRYVTWDPIPIERVLVLNRGLMRFVNDDITVVNGQAVMKGGPNIMDGLPLHRPDWELNYRWHEVPLRNVPKNAIGNCAGQVNDAVFDGFAIGTLLCKMPRLRIYRGQLGKRLADISYKFIYRPNWDAVSLGFLGWNGTPYVSGGRLRYFFVSSTGTSAGDPPHRYVDFRTLFQPEF